MFSLRCSTSIQNPINGITIPIISQSYGACEPGFPTATLNTIESLLAQANSQGQTVVLAAGDTGAADCDSSNTQTITSATQGLAVDYPGSSAYVTDLGGSEFMGDGTAAESADRRRHILEREWQRQCQRRFDHFG